MPESALTAPKEKKLTGRQWFESGRATAVSNFFFSAQNWLEKNKNAISHLWSLFLFSARKVLLLLLKDLRKMTRRISILMMTLKVMPLNLPSFSIIVKRIQPWNKMSFSRNKISVNYQKCVFDITTYNWDKKKKKNPIIV